MLDQINRFADLINLAKDCQHKELMPDNVECMIMVDEDEDEPGTYECYYYLVHPQKQILFWMNNFDAAQYIIDIDGVESPAHFSKHSILFYAWMIRHELIVNLEHLLESLFWLVTLKARYAPALFSQLWAFLIVCVHHRISMHSKSFRTHWETFPDGHIVTEEVRQEVAQHLVFTGYGLF